MNRPSTPEASGVSKPHYDTPQKAAIQQTIAYLESRQLPCNKKNVFAFNSVDRSQGYQILRETTARKRHSSGLIETHGRNPKLTGAQIQEADVILEEEELGLEGRRYTWVDKSGLSDSDPELGSDCDSDGCSSEDELSRSGSRMNVPWDPIDEQRLLAYKKEGKSWKWIFRQFPSRTQPAVRTRLNIVQARGE